MAHLLTLFTVEDYAKWKTVFDEHAPMRKAHGSQGGRRFRNADNPSEIIVLLEWDDVEKAREFAGSEDLREAMQQAGVVGRPETRLMEEEEAATA